MTVTLLVEGPSDEQILRALLRVDEQKQVSFFLTSDRSSLASIARTLIVKHRTPIAVMLDTDTLDPTAIRDLVLSFESLLGAVAGNTVPYKVIYCVPEIETIFFDRPFDAHKLFPNVPPSFMVMIAKTSPKKALEYLFAEGGGPTNLTQLLEMLSAQDKSNLRNAYPIQHLTTFIEEWAAVVR